MVNLGGFKHGLLHGKGLLKWEDDFGNTLSYEGTFFYNCLHESGDYNWNGRGAYAGKVSFQAFYGLWFFIHNYLEWLKHAKN